MGSAKKKQSLCNRPADFTHVPHLNRSCFSSKNENSRKVAYCYVFELLWFLSNVLILFDYLIVYLVYECGKVRHSRPQTCLVRSRVESEAMFATFERNANNAHFVNTNMLTFSGYEATTFTSMLAC